MRRLYIAVCGLIEAHTEVTRSPGEPQRDVDMPGTLAEDINQTGGHELNQHANRDDDELWGDDPRRIGFTAPIGRQRP